MDIAMLMIAPETSIAMRCLMAVAASDTRPPAEIRSRGPNGLTLVRFVLLLLPTGWSFPNVRRFLANPKRRLHPGPRELDLLTLASRATYGGNPQHKRNPGEFGLNPPADPRQEKTLCDPSGILTREAAARLLRDGIRRGLVSAQIRNGWPQNVWAVMENGMVFEAMLENETTGAYHGYPILQGDPLRDDILEAWKQR